MQVQSRTRYSFWSALSDVGGLADGLAIIVSFFVSPIAAAYYERDLIKESLIDPKHSAKHDRKQIRLAQALDRPNNEGPILSQSNNFETLIDSIKRLKKVKMEVFELLLTCLCRSVRKHKGYKNMQKFVKFKSNQLDIRRIISNSITLTDFFRCFLSEQ